MKPGACRNINLFLRMFRYARAFVAALAWLFALAPRAATATPPPGDARIREKLGHRLLAEGHLTGADRAGRRGLGPLKTVQGFYQLLRTAVLAEIVNVRHAGHSSFLNRRALPVMFMPRKFAR